MNCLSSYIKFAKKVNGSGWNKGMINRGFRLQVDKEDYAVKEKDEILSFLYTLAKRPSI